MKLFFVPGSPYARMVRVALMETGLAGQVEEVEVTLRDPASALLPHNPVGRVPSLMLDSGLVLTETLLILTVLDRMHGGRPLLPLDGADGWQHHKDTGRAVGMLDGIAVWNRELRRPVHERSPGVIALEETRANRTADVIEGIVADGGYAGPLNAAQIALACALGYVDKRHTVWQWRDSRPKLTAWYQTVVARPSFQATVPPPSGI